MKTSQNTQLKSNGKIVVVGSINCDITTYINHFPKTHETIMAERTAVSVGGKGLNQAVAASRAGAEVSMVACIGRDQFGDQALTYLKENNVSTGHISYVDDIGTGTATIFVSQSGENMIAVSPAANSSLTPELVEKSRDIIAEADILIVQLEIPLDTVKTALTIARENGVKTILNPAPANVNAVNLLPLVDIVTPNETETEALVGINPDSTEKTEQALKAFQLAEASGIIITKGESGCSISIDQQRTDVGTFQVEMVDATGAGDVFNGVFAVCIAQNMAYEEAARTASAAAAISVTRPMAEGAAPFDNEIKQFLETMPYIPPRKNP